MKVSVIIPAYNEEAYIGKTLQSLKDQTLSPQEVIVVDNNSKDKTASIAKKYGATVISEKKQGMIHARNCGFDSAQYAIIARCDADVILPRDWIQKIVQAFETKNIEGLSGPVVYYDSYIKTKSPLPSQAYFWILKLITGGNRYLVGMNMIITKKIWMKVKSHVILDDTKVHEDIDLSMKILKAGGIISHDKTLIVRASARRIIKRPWSFFIEYPFRMAKTFWYNRK